MVAVDIGKTSPAYLRNTVTVRVEAGLAKAGYDVMTLRQVSARLSGDQAKCRAAACAKQIGELLNVRALVFASVDVEDENARITLRMLDASTGQHDTEVTEVCELCSAAEFGARIAAAAAELRTRAAAARAGRTAPPTPPATPPRSSPQLAPRPIRSIVPGVSVSVAGGLAVGAGVYLIAIDGKGTCSPGDQPAYPAPGAVIRYPDPSNQDVYVCREIYQTKSLGLVTAAVGIAAITAGVTLVIRAKHHDRSVEVGPVAGGATVKVTLSW